MKQYLEVYPNYCRMMGENVALRTYMMNMFAGLVAEHVQNYTVPQYGDYPNDPIASWTRDDCLKQIQKYVNRFFTNSRGTGELEKDLLKIAHYCQLAYFKEQDLEKEFLVLAKKNEVKESTDAQNIS